MNPQFFSTQEDFRAWLQQNHETAQELWVGYYKVGSNKASITYSQSVDEAICFGWIDGIRKSIDKDSYCNRFTPRRKKSIWSAINIAKVEKLLKQGLMHDSGIECYNKRTDDKSRAYSYENIPSKLPDELEIKLRANEKAWLFFSKQAPSHQKTIMYWIMSAKQESTRLSRLEKLITASEAGIKL
ncbi:MAG: bacteriocin-protection protein [Bacteroidales bacterium]|nr:bacteriocin-protection protein [Bacteroidales bacterium]